MFRLHWSNSLILTGRRKFRLWKWEWMKQMQTNATRDLLTKGSSSWQWDVTGGQSSLHLTSQIKMLCCTPLLKIFKAKCTLTDIKYTPLSDNKTSPVTREVATSPTENWQLSLFALPRVLIFYFNGVSHLTIYLMFLFRLVTYIHRWVLTDNSGEELNLVFFASDGEILCITIIIRW